MNSLNASPSPVAAAFETGFDYLKKMIPGIDEVSRRYGFARRVEKVYQLCWRSAPGGCEPSEVLSSAIANCSEPLSYLALYDQLQKRGIIGRESIKTLLDLGCGYWNSSVAYDLVFPHLEKAVGIDFDSRKVAYWPNARAAFSVCDRKFEMRRGDFFAEAEVPPWHNSALYDFVVLQSFHAGHKDVSSLLPRLFQRLRGAISDQATIVVIMDRKDLTVDEYRGSLQMAEFCRKVPGLRYVEGLKRMTACGAFRMNHDVEVETFVLPASGLGR